MLLKIWFVLIFEFVNYPLQIRAGDEKKTCPAHEKWTVFQRRKYGNVNFFRGWDDYVNGFGDCNGDLWLGLETLHELTKGDDMSLEINMMTKGKNDHMRYKYRSFSIGHELDHYRLHISGFSGNVTADALALNNNRRFTTKDADHDNWRLNCASHHEGAWWYWGWCTYSNLNGNFNKTDHKGIWWMLDMHAFTGTRHILCCSEMKVYKRIEGTLFS